MESKALMVMDKRTMMERIEAARFPQALTAPEKNLLAMVAISYGFDPLMGEISIFQGRPYVSIDGRYRKAQETGRLIGVRSRPATKQERADWQIPDGDYFFHTDVFIKGGGLMSFEGWGRVLKEETIAKTPGDSYKPIVKNPQRMAEKRAEAQALRKAFHINLPSIEMAGTGTEEDENNPNIINMETGEIIPEGEKPKADPEQAQKDIDEFYDKPQTSKPANTTVDLTTMEFKNPGEFFAACFKYFKLQKSAVDKEISIYDLQIPEQRKEAWKTIIALYKKD